MKKTALHTTSMVMLKRISKNYSPEELSFLIGCEPGYVKSMEDLEGDGYKPEEIKRIGKALEERNFKVFYAKKDLGERVDVEMASLVEGVEILHLYRTFDKDGQEIPLFAVKESIASHEITTALEQADYTIAKDALKVLTDAGYFFAARTHQQIYNRINKFLPAGVLKPFYLREALNELSAECDTAILQKVLIDEVRPGYLEL